MTASRPDPVPLRVLIVEDSEDDVQLDELIDRLRAMLVQGLVVDKDVSSTLGPISLAGQRATSLALVFSELFGNALEHGGGTISITLTGRDGDVVLAIADDGDGMQAAPDSTGLSIVRALVRDELGGELTLVDGPGLCAEVRFPARTRGLM